MLAHTGEEPAAGEFRCASYTNTTDHITFTIYDVRGRVAARLVDMEMAPGTYQVTWSATGQNGQEAPAGTYFARSSNSLTGITKKFTVLR